MANLIAGLNRHSSLLASIERAMLRIFSHGDGNKHQRDEEHG
jgi:hypothetical protein